MKKIFILTFLFSTSLFAETFYCRSYNFGGIVIADSVRETITFKDRFGNELDVLGNIQVFQSTLNTTPEIIQTTFMRGEEKVFVTNEQSGFIRGSTESDDSFLCFVRH